MSEDRRQIDREILNEIKEVKSMVYEIREDRAVMKTQVEKLILDYGRSSRGKCGGQLLLPYPVSVVCCLLHLNCYTKIWTQKNPEGIISQRGFLFSIRCIHPSQSIRRPCHTDLRQATWLS
jgi:hypothetical protein